MPHRAGPGRPQQVSPSCHEVAWWPFPQVNRYGTAGFNPCVTGSNPVRPPAEIARYAKGRHVCPTSASVPVSPFPTRLRLPGDSGSGHLFSHPFHLPPRLDLHFSPTEPRRVSGCLPSFRWVSSATWRRERHSTQEPRSLHRDRTPMPPIRTSRSSGTNRVLCRRRDLA
jgi:hypothetical protein